MKILKYIIFPAVLFIFYPSVQAETKPSNKDLEKALSWELPGFVEIKDFDVEASQNLGDEIDPKWGARFQATISTKSNLYKMVAIENTVTIVDLVNKKDAIIEIYGKIYSNLYQGKWKHKIEIDGDPLSAQKIGSPKNQVSNQRNIVRGSEEEKKYYDSIPVLVFEEIINFPQEGGREIMQLEPGFRYQVSSSGKWSIEDPREEGFTTINCQNGDQPNRVGGNDRPYGKLPYTYIFGYGVFIFNGHHYAPLSTIIPDKSGTLIFDANIPNEHNYHSKSKNVDCKVMIKRGKVF